jgi:hypothetical protein
LTGERPRAVFDVRAGDLPVGLCQCDGFGVAVNALREVTLGCQPTHVATCATSDIQDPTFRGDQVAPTLKPSRRVFGAVHREGVQKIRNKTTVVRTT